MSPDDLVVRCMVRQDGPVFVAVCLDLCLAAQGDTMAEAKNRLAAQITDYVNQAFTVHHAHAADLLLRKAPLVDRLQFRWAEFKEWARPHLERAVYSVALPLRPAFA